jgi:SAM-dependent methyltransferase
LLEAAAGVGAYAELWRRKGVARWVGIDISEDAVAHCRRRFPDCRFLTLDLTSKDWPRDCVPADGFDLVTAIDVLYHLVDDAAFETALSNVAARVRPGGALLVSDVFVERERQIAPHVKRRPLSAYSRTLGSGFVLARREPVFSVLADPVPRSGFHFADEALRAAWGVLARIMLCTPPAWRNAAGTTLATVVRPVDAALRRAGLSRGVNLELALFVRREPAHQAAGLD